MAYLRLDRLLGNICCLNRNDADKAIRRARVTLNGQVVRTPNTKVDTECDCVTLDGCELVIRERIYIMMNKPEGVVCSSDGKEKSVYDILPENMRRKELFTVGRLDKDTTGLVIITDDGNFVHNAASPKRKVSKQYIATLVEPLTDEMAEKWRSGMTLADGDVVSPAEVELLSSDRLKVKITIHEGKYHQIKRMAGAVSNRIVTLKRVAIGEILLDDSLEVGECRYLTETEEKVYN